MALAEGNSDFSLLSLSLQKVLTKNAFSAFILIHHGRPHQAGIPLYE